MGDGDMLLSRITVTRHIDEDGQDLFGYEAEDGSGDELSIVEILGLLELAKDTALRSAMGED
ncbi:hypothetical protein ENKNEFLB_02096 [Nocardioides aquaticus]|uniref:Uncharacterized protein n=1 Tax=Nocardioides aquaticus TaxID=160826 RepID=A0ABX8EHB4_9ACTN|nr:hypothetical protein [Nocardioides aquaticus]QVT79706.1 hypothetical protein ENKNEFLB_02096 [Nocardioides aquaticus]